MERLLRKIDRKQAHCLPSLLGNASLWARSERRSSHNAMMESLIETLEIEGVYPLAVEAAEDGAEHLPRLIEKCNIKRLHSGLGYLSPNQIEKRNIRPLVKTAA